MNPTSRFPGNLGKVNISFVSPWNFNYHMKRWSSLGFIEAHYTFSRSVEWILSSTDSLGWDLTSQAFPSITHYCLLLLKLIQLGFTITWHGVSLSHYINSRDFQCSVFWVFASWYAYPWCRYNGLTYCRGILHSKINYGSTSEVLCGM